MPLVITTPYNVPMVPQELVGSTPLAELNPTIGVELLFSPVPLSELNPTINDIVVLFSPVPLSELNPTIES